MLGTLIRGLKGASPYWSLHTARSGTAQTLDSSLSASRLSESMDNVNSGRVIMRKQETWTDCPELYVHIPSPVEHVGIGLHTNKE